MLMLFHLLPFFNKTINGAVSYVVLTLAGCEDYFEDVGLVFLNDVSMIYLLGSYFLLKIFSLVCLTESILKTINLPMDIIIMTYLHLYVLYSKWKFTLLN